MKYKDNDKEDIKKAIKYAKTSMEMEGFVVTTKDEKKVKKKILKQKGKDKNGR